MGTPKPLTVAALQCSLRGSVQQNVARVSELVREAADQGAQIILPPELFEGPYFCKVEKEEFFALARPLAGHPTVGRFQELAKRLKVV
ncbi:MAG TPA: nitrilase-related carbon-nitrogen hydrolase, partial [Bdellovibrionota bacterium]|nr:nitrilase-related carbon-nitrogen hydrolase [Bdellovibrionota bacterium]